jgi:uncharacterized membrane protein
MGQAAATRKPLGAVLAISIPPLLFHFVIVMTSSVRFDSALSFGVLFKFGFVTVSALTHWTIYGGLLLMFARTLRRGREPLITALARRMHDDFSADLARYTRRVTIAWTCFFAVQLVASIALFCLAPLVVWSFFVNVVDLPLVAAMFLVEYACRLRCLRNPPRHSLAAILNMVAELRKPQAERAVSL